MFALLSCELSHNVLLTFQAKKEMVQTFIKHTLEQTQKRFKQCWIEQQENKYFYYYLRQAGLALKTCLNKLCAIVAIKWHQLTIQHYFMSVPLFCLYFEKQNVFGKF